MNLADSFRAARWIRLINLLLQAGLFLTLIFGLNYIALNHAWRFDLTQNRRNSLSAETKSYLERLDRSVKVTVTLTDEGDNEELRQTFHDITGLLREYSYFTHNNTKGGVSVEFLNVYQNRRRAEELGIDQPNVVVLQCDGHRRVMPVLEFYRVNLKEKRKETFLGEAALTAAILDVSSPEKKKIYFVAGHGEMRPDDVDGARGLSQLRDELRQRNYELAGLDFTLSHKIPDDAALLIIASPQGRFQPYEEELLRNYLQTRAGRLIVMLDPVRAHGLDSLFFDWGVIVYDNLICDTSGENLTTNGDFYLRRFRAHPITQNLINYEQPLLVGPARSVSDDIGRPADDGLDVKTLVNSSPSSWGEKSYNRPPFEYTPGVDQRQKDGLGVFVISERVKPANLPLSVRGGRLAVFGTADLVTNNRIFNPGNLNLFLATVSWTVDRDIQLNIPARPIQRFQLALSQEELTRLRLGLLLIVPGAVALLGLAVYWTRRN
jgi:hypothetical protein